MKTFAPASIEHQWLSLFATLNRPSSVDAVGDEPHDLARGGPDEAVQIKPLVAVMAAGGRTAAAWRPDLAQDRFQAEAVFIERPDFDRNRRLGALELADAGLELFLNRACSYRLALGLAGRGT